MNAHRKHFALAALLCAVSFQQWLAQAPARAHPATQGFVEVVLNREKIILRTRISVEEVVISNQLRVESDGLYALAREHYDKHAQYMLKHIHVLGDQKPLAGIVLSVTPRSKETRFSPLKLQAEFVVCEFEYPLNPAALPAVVKITQDMLNEFQYAPGNPWEVTYIARIGHDDKEMEEGLLLTNAIPVLFPCDWRTPPPVALPENAPAPQTPPTPAKPARVDLAGMALSFIQHGIGHIIGHRTARGWENIGIDHLLFVAALVLGAASAWDLVKLVTAFTLAHTLTMTLCVLDIFRLPERVVEPMIAASIVFIAVENIFWPQRTRGWGRLGAAFFFGLFHGLGFAGGLLDAMSGMQTSAVLMAVAAFSLGVELGHQAVVLPLFGALRLVRRTQKDEPAQQQFARASLTYGSLIISVAGMFYLVTALGWV